MFVLHFSPQKSSFIHHNMPVLPTFPLFYEGLPLNGRKGYEQMERKVVKEDINMGQFEGTGKTDNCQIAHIIHDITTFPIKL